MSKEIYEETLGRTVVCDICNKDFTDSDEQGGFIFAGYAYCPECAKAGLENIEKYDEKEYVKAICPEGTSFADFCRDFRGEDAKISITEL